MTTKVIKSVGRIFEILELFEEERRPLAAKEISKQLDYPLMSTHELLKSMAELGYADYDQPNWSYIPSRKLIQLTGWLEEFHDRDTNILNLMEDLSAITKETINLSQQVDHQVKIIHGIECQHPVGVSVKVGTLMPLSKSLTGVVSLYGLSQQEIEAKFKSGPIPYENDDLECVKKIHTQLDESQAAIQSDLFVNGIGAVCIPVKSKPSNKTFVIGIVGPSDRINSSGSKYRSELLKLTKKHKIQIVKR